VVVVVVVVDPGSFLVDESHVDEYLAGWGPSVLRMPWESIFVVGVVVGVGEGSLDLTALVMQEEFGRGVVESIAVKLTCVPRLQIFH
jgi:hypothetical protein